MTHAGQETGKEQNMVHEEEKTRNRQERNSTVSQNKARKRKQDTGKVQDMV